MTCTFFGHRDAPNKIMPVLQAALVDLIENKHVDRFYVGNQGAFDCIVRSSLEELESEYPHIRYSVVLAYLPQKDTGYDYSHSVYPDGFESHASMSSLWGISHCILISLGMNGVPV